MQFKHTRIIVVTTGILAMMSVQSPAWDRYYRPGQSLCCYRHSALYCSSSRLPGYTRYYRPQYADHYTVEDGWDLIRRHQSHTAFEIFMDIAESNPAAGQPKLGIAVAAADTGRLPRSVWAMRRLLEFTPAAIQLFRPDDWLIHRLRRLVGKYHSRSHGLPQKDAVFMQASLYYLLKDKTACLAAIDLSREVNDDSDSARNLYHIAENDL